MRVKNKKITTGTHSFPIFFLLHKRHLINDDNIKLFNDLKDATIDGNSILHFISEISDLEKFKKIYESSTLKNKEAILKLKNKDGWNALTVAVMVGNLSVAKYLINKDRKLLYNLDKEGSNILYCAAKYYDVNIFNYIFSELSKDKNNTELKKMMLAKSKKGDTVINIAIKKENTELINFLISKEPLLLTQQNASKNNIFHIAVELGNLKIIKTLIDAYKKYDKENELKKVLNAKNKERETLINIAIKNGNNKVIKYLLKINKELLYKVNKDGENIFHFASRYGDLKLFKYFLKLNDNFYYTNKNEMRKIFIDLVKKFEETAVKVMYKGVLDIELYLADILIKAFKQDKLFLRNLLKNAEFKYIEFLLDKIPDYRFYDVFNIKENNSKQSIAIKISSSERKDKNLLKYLNSRKEKLSLSERENLKSLSGKNSDIYSKNYSHGNKTNPFDGYDSVEEFENKKTVKAKKFRKKRNQL